MHNLIYITCLQTSNNRIQKLRHLSITDHDYLFSFVANPLFYFRGVYLEFSLPLPLTNETFNFSDKKIIHESERLRLVSLPQELHREHFDLVLSCDLSSGIESISFTGVRTTIKS